MKQHLLFEELHVTTQEELYKKLHEDMTNYNLTYQENLDKYGQLNTEYDGIWNDFIDSYESALKELQRLKEEILDIANLEDFTNSGNGSSIDFGDIASGIGSGIMGGIVGGITGGTPGGIIGGIVGGILGGSGGTSNTGNSSSNDKYYGSSSSSNGNYVISSDKGKDFVNNAKPGSTMTGGDGSSWTKNPDGSTTIKDKNGNTWNVPKYKMGIENGPVTTTGLAMLHGTFSKPEYVLNNDQAWQLLKNFSTTKMPEISSRNSSYVENYNINGDVVLNDVKDPSQFWNKLMEATSNRFNVTKKK